MILSTIKQLFRVEAALLILPALVSLYYGEGIGYIYLIVIFLELVVSLLMGLVKPRSKRILAKEGFVIVALSWIFMSFFGCLPFVFSGAIPNILDAFFETVSGFTTTGATILTDIEALPKSILLWRSFTHWLGGMGVIVFVLAILPQEDMQSMHILRAEVPGPSVGKIVSKTKVTARILYMLYGLLTLMEALFLCIGRVPLFDSLTIAFSTAGTGGFAIKNLSIAAYNNLYVEVVVTIFMILFGVNFNIFYLLAIRQVKRVLKSEELWTYLCIIVASSLIIAINIYRTVENVVSFGNALRQSTFTVASIISTTGFVTADFDIWPTLSRVIITVLMFVGAMAGSTGGGLKVARILILLKSAMREIKKMLNPGMVKSIKIDGAVVDNETVSATNSYFFIYMLILLFSVLIVSLNGFDFVTSLSSVITCLNNVGPGLSKVGPTCNYAGLSYLSKMILVFDMLVGRLEIFPMVILLTPSSWRKNK